MYSIGVIAYLLLSKTLPYMAKSEQEMATHIIKGELKFNKKIWKDLSRYGIDFCKSK